MTTSTEQDIIKQVVKKGQLADPYRESQQYIAGSQWEGQEDDKEQFEKDQVRVATRIWTALAKLIRSQTTKDRVIDTLYFGSFSKASILGMNLEKIGSVGSFAYCPGPRSMFTLLEDDHNQKYFPQGVLDEKLVSISFQAIADVCSCTSDFVQTVLQSIRDELVEIVTAKGRAVSLNLIIGSLSVNQSGQVSFKSLTIEQVARQQQRQAKGNKLTEKSLRGLEDASGVGGTLSSRKQNSQKSIAERSINFMQKRQATAPSGSRRSKQASVANADDIFSTPGKNTEDAPKYFQKRINNQSQKRRSNDYIDGVVRRSNDPLGDMSRKQANLENHNHLNSFLRDQILRKQGNDGAGPRERQSASAAPASRRSSVADETAIMNATGTNLGHMVMVSGYQADPLAATLNQRSIGLSKLNVSKKQMDEDNFLFDQTNKIRGGIGVIHKTPQFQPRKAGQLGDTQSQRSAGGRARSIAGVALGDDDKREIIKNALNRKQISHDYHTTLPKFMKSQGPFAVYEHAVHKGSSTANIASAVTEMALKRHFDEVVALQNKRVSEKDQFYKTMESLDRQQAIRNQHTKTNHARNQEYIRQQILEKALMKKQVTDVERLYYKPHFGPEETADIALEHERKAKAMKSLLRQSLAEQLAEQKAVSEASKRHEKEADKIFLDTAADTQYIENYAVAKKNQIMKQNLKETWDRQIQYRKDHVTTDNYFK